MEQKNFILTSLTIHPKCEDLYRKILRSETYHFNQLDGEMHSLENDIFGHRIIIQTIVGENGSGKSSLLEVMYRMINNFSYFILKYTQPKRIAAAPVFLIEQLYADLNFIINGQSSTLMIRHRSLALIRGDERICFGDDRKEFEGFRNLNSAKKAVILELASSFFYTIVTNYSFQSLISQDFANDIAKDFIGSKNSGTASSGNWLDSLFHKNDGYITPIVLNPYRNEGAIDLQREYFLTLARIAALLLDARDRKRSLLSGYELKTIRYKATHKHFIGKLFEKYEPNDDAIHLTSIMMSLRDKKTVGAHIIHAYGLKLPELQEEKQIIPYAYLVYKTLSVLDKYAQFEAFDKIPAIREFHESISDEAKKSLTAAIVEILRHHSHVNIKVFQTLNYIGSYKTLIDEVDSESYLPLGQKKGRKNLDELIENLPPPFFEQDIRLTRENEPNSDLAIASLSSGERQFIYTISTIIYHIKNLLSIQQSNRIRYRNVNIVLDEVEICFHPEYQRLFISRLLELIDRLNLTRNCAFNILIVTHSPFILSDVPKRNILYLKDGRQHNDETMINPFAANINDILYQSFFLKGGFIGEHAKKMINEAVEVLDRKISKLPVSKKTFWTGPRLEQLIKMIGEPLLKDNLADMYRQAFEQPSHEELLAAKDQEIEALKRQLEQR